MLQKTFTSAQRMSDHDMIYCVRKINYKYTIHQALVET